MKKIVCAVLLFFASSVMADEGKFDGIRYSDVIGYISVHERNGIMIVIRLSESMRLWEAHMGPRNGNTFRIETIKSPGAITVTNITMTSDITFSATQESCRVTDFIYSCLLPDGYTFTGTKIW